MLARWNLKTTPDGLAVQYDNLRDQVSMNCGVTEMSAQELLTYMVDEGGGGHEIVFIDGDLAWMLMPAVSDSACPRPYLTNTTELQG